MTHGGTDLFDGSLGSVGPTDEGDFHAFDDILQEISHESRVGYCEVPEAFTFFEQVLELMDLLLIEGRAGPLDEPSVSGEHSTK